MIPGAYIPCKELQPYVQFFLVQETDIEQTVKVLPGNGIVIGFQYKGRMSYFENDNEISLSGAGITGINDRFRLFKNAAGTGTILVYFTETGAAPFFREPLHELFRESVSLDNFMLRSDLLLVEEALCEAPTNDEKIRVIEKFLLNRLHPQQPDELVIAALSLIHKAKGDIRIGDIARQLFISQAPLEKRFRKIVGASPKKIASIIRLKNAIGQYRQNTSLTSLSHEAGFYDQAHFIREFRSFTGETPEIFFRNNGRQEK